MVCFAPSHSLSRSLSFSAGTGAGHVPLQHQSSIKEKAIRVVTSKPLKRRRTEKLQLNAHLIMKEILFVRLNLFSRKKKFSISPIWAVIKDFISEHSLPIECPILDCVPIYSFLKNCESDHLWCHKQSTRWWYWCCWFKIENEKKFVRTFFAHNWNKTSCCFSTVSSGIILHLQAIITNHC